MEIHRPSCRGTISKACREKGKGRGIVSRHSFDPEIASKVGLNAAVIYQNIYWWCEKNAANSKNLRDGKVWTYNSLSAFDELFPYLTKKQIRLALEKLVEAGLIVVGNYNKDPRDQTKWYALEGTLQLPERANGAAQKGKPLPDSKPVIKQTPKPPQGADLFADQGDAEDDGTFDEFWKAYPKKAGKEAARKAWAKATKKTTPSEIIEGAKRYAEWLKNAPEGEFRPHAKHPQGWLSSGRWADEEIWNTSQNPPSPRGESYAKTILRQYGGSQP
jgi:hypothetical protein